MHWQQMHFVYIAKAVMPQYFSDVRVLEIGSYNVNGSVRPLFQNADYVGVDLTEGPGVDVVCSGDKYRSSEKFDIIISIECFEHNSKYLETFENMIAHGRDGALVIFTCASEGRAEHGTALTNPDHSPGTSAINSNYYMNLSQQDFEGVDFPERFSNWYFYDNRDNSDLYFIGSLSKNGKNVSKEFAEIKRKVPQIKQIGRGIKQASALGKIGETKSALDSLFGAQFDIENPLLLRAIARFLMRQGHRKIVEELLCADLQALNADINWADFLGFVASLLQRQGRLAEAKQVSHRVGSLTALKESATGSSAGCP